MNNNKVAFYVLGCKVNQSEAESMAALFRQRGYQVVDFHDRADVYVVHTCTVTHLGDSNSRQMIRRAVRANPDAVIAVTGCYAQVSPGEICAIPGVDLVIGTQDRGRIVELVEKVQKGQAPFNLVSDLHAGNEFEELPLGASARVRAAVKIQEGCNQFCTYCIVPRARGPVRSRDPLKTVAEVERLVDAGYREIVLTGIHIGSYGLDLPGNEDLATLIRRLIRIPRLHQLRVSSIEPNEFSPDLVGLLTGTPVICSHLHIPLQSGSDEVLKRMGRRYTAASYGLLLHQLRERDPEISVTTDVIVGFPGESDHHFEQTYGLVASLSLTAMHVFKYSPRKGTPAACFPSQVPQRVKEQRSSRLLELSRSLWHKYAGHFVGRTLEVLVEQRRTASGLWEGHTGNYLKVVFPGEEGLKGGLMQVLVTGLREGYLSGEPVPEGGERK